MKTTLHRILICLINIILGLIAACISLFNFIRFSFNFYSLIVLEITLFLMEMWTFLIGYNPVRKTPNKKRKKVMIITSVISFIFIIIFLVFVFQFELERNFLIICLFLINLQITLFGISELSISFEKIEPIAYKPLIFLSGIAILIFSSYIYVFIWENTIFLYLLNSIILCKGLFICMVSSGLMEPEKIRSSNLELNNNE